jgi:hypothetical protein
LLCCAAAAAASATWRRRRRTVWRTGRRSHALMGAASRGGRRFATIRLRTAAARSFDFRRNAAQRVRARAS